MYRGNNSRMGSTILLSSLAAAGSAVADGTNTNVAADAANTFSNGVPGVVQETNLEHQVEAVASRITRLKSQINDYKASGTNYNAKASSAFDGAELLISKANADPEKSQKFALYAAAEGIYRHVISRPDLYIDEKKKGQSRFGLDLYANIGHSVSMGEARFDNDPSPNQETGANADLLGVGIRGRYSLAKQFDLFLDLLYSHGSAQATRDSNSSRGNVDAGMSYAANFQVVSLQAGADWRFVDTDSVDLGLIFSAGVLNVGGDASGRAAGTYRGRPVSQDQDADFNETGFTGFGGAYAGIHVSRNWQLFLGAGYQGPDFEKDVDVKSTVSAPFNNVNDARANLKSEAGPRYMVGLRYAPRTETGKGNKKGTMGRKGRK